MEWLFLLAWYASGLVGSWLVVVLIRKNFDVTVGDALMGMLFAVLGPISLVAGIALYISAHVPLSRVILHKRGLRE